MTLYVGYSRLGIGGGGGGGGREKRHSWYKKKEGQRHPRIGMLMLFCSIPKNILNLDHQLPYLEIMSDLFLLLAILTVRSTILKGRLQAVFLIRMHDSILFVSIVDDDWEPPPMLQSQKVSEATEGMYYLS